MTRTLLVPTRPVLDHSGLLQLWADLCDPWPVHASVLRVVPLEADGSPWGRVAELPVDTGEFAGESERLLTGIVELAEDVVPNGSVAVLWQLADVAEPSPADRSALNAFALGLRQWGASDWPVGVRHRGRVELLS